MDIEGEGEVLWSGLDESVRGGVGDGAWLGAAADTTTVLAVVLTLAELAATAPPVVTEVPAVPVASRGLSSDCWMILTPSGLLHEDSLVLAL